MTRYEELKRRIEGDLDTVSSDEMREYLDLREAEQLRADAEHRHRDSLRGRQRIEFALRGGRAA